MELIQDFFAPKTGMELNAQRVLIQDSCLSLHPLKYYFCLPLFLPQECSECVANVLWRSLAEQSRDFFMILQTPWH